MRSPAVTIWFSQAFSLLLSALFPSYMPAGVAGNSETQNWAVAGQAMTSCSCFSPCPCRSNFPPAPESFCENTEFAHFDSGYFENTDLSAVQFIMTQRVFAHDGWHVLYIDERASPQQQSALLLLLGILGYDHFSAVTVSPIRFTVSEDNLTFTVAIPGILEMYSRRPSATPSGSGTGTRAIDMWGDRIVYASNVIHRYHDYKLKKGWDWSGRQSNHKTFRTFSEQYELGQIGWRNYDGTGSKGWICQTCRRSE